MKFLQCMFCRGELEILQDKGIHKKVKCSSCGFTNNSEVKEPEVVIIRRRPSL
jgi:hypothetical protein